MARRAVFLRGMNLGGRRLKNAELIEAVEGLGFREVSAILASGNLVLEGGRAAPATLQRRLEEGLAEALGYAVPTFVRSGAELEAYAEAFPFADAMLAGKGRPQLVLLRESLDARQRDEVEAARDPKDLVEPGERCLWWLPAAGVSTSETDWRRIDRALGETTTRTWATIEKVRARLESDHR